MKQVNYSEIARNTGLSVSHVSRVMRGKRTPTVWVLRAMAKEMGMDMEELAIELDKVKGKK